MPMRLKSRARAGKTKPLKRPQPPKELGTWSEQHVSGDWLLFQKKVCVESPPLSFSPEAGANLRVKEIPSPSPGSGEGRDGGSSWFYFSPAYHSPTAPNPSIKSASAFRL